MPQLAFSASRFAVSHTDTCQITQAQMAWPHDSGLLPAKGSRVFVSTGAPLSAGFRLAFDVLEFHPRVMELPASVQDCVVVHELCHTVEKNYTKAFWAHHAVIEQACLAMRSELKPFRPTTHDDKFQHSLERIGAAVRQH
jgi:Protein of unknown function DUF45